MFKLKLKFNQFLRLIQEKLWLSNQWYLKKMKFKIPEAIKTEEATFVVAVVVSVKEFAATLVVLKMELTANVEAA